ncbi:monooxygenase [Aspergillus steynii IBT 23096]|uniref:Monooxygenase n=1 Tax=Aspergillus steynii IBT 23096 TaxID=1392250 RepID=A0A2I2GRK6_9EURO|nr:monooxygenase [Aspergillus steynii IBT 23096]PLB55512.1 monooxygenase [Aspergillus steynii IBT 23096]
MDHPNFHVVIVGGSIAGLTLAHCLQRANISHVVLEKGKEIAPQLGASVAIFANGARILQQLGIYEDIEREIEPIGLVHAIYPDGFYYNTRYPDDLTKRFGYPISFLSRQRFLDVLYKTYPDSSRILTGKRVTEIRHLDHGSCVITEDGSVYQGDLIVGADGVHSRVRSEIWKQAEQEPGRIIAKEKSSMMAEFVCVFGMSSPVPGLHAGEQTNVFFDGLTIATIHGQNGRLFWFFVKKLDRKYPYADMARFSNDDAAQFCSQIENVHILNGVYVRDVWKNRTAVSMTALEESLLETWHSDRMVLIGDSIHKMTINAGQGANMAIEDAAFLGSLIEKLVRTTSPRGPSTLDISRTLEKYKKGRYDRVKSVYNVSWHVARIHGRAGLLYSLIGRYYIPYKKDLLADMTSKVMADANLIEFLPVPKRSGPGWEKYSSKRGGMSQVQWLILFVLVLAFVWVFRGLGGRMPLDRLLSPLPRSE